MLLTAPSHGCRQAQRRLFVFMRNGTFPQYQGRQIVLPRQMIRRVHGDKLPHDTHTEGIRNIGIIAHVDAVRPRPTLLHVFRCD